MKVNPNQLDFKEKDFDEVVEILRDLLFKKKEKQYNQVSKVYDYFPYIPESFKTMIWIKTLRIMNQEHFEELDSLLDLIAYTMFMFSLYERDK